jgi:hypothetical protein
VIVRACRRANRSRFGDNWWQLVATGFDWLRLVRARGGHYGGIDKAYERVWTERGVGTAIRAIGGPRQMWPDAGGVDTSISRRHFTRVSRFLKAPTTKEAVRPRIRGGSADFHTASRMMPRGRSWERSKGAVHAHRQQGLHPT